MDSTKIPVTLDFFKKYTYHEEWVDVMFKAKAKGNQQIYNALCNSPESKERALKLYYEAFYLKPEIRKKYHIRLKPAPKKIKDKLLTIPMPDDSRQANENGNKTQQYSPMQELFIGELAKTAESSTDGLINNEGNAKKKDIERKRLIIQATDSSDQEVEDDSQPISSPEKINSTTELNENRILVETIQDNDITPVEIIIHETVEKETQKPSVSSKKSPIVIQKPNEIPAIGSSHSKEHNLNDLAAQQTNNIVTPTPSPRKSPAANGKIKAIMSTESNNNLQQNLKEATDHDPTSELQIQTPAANQKPFDYKSLVPYLHCCPITYKEFRKYSNINQLVKELCKKKQLNSHEERLILNRSYILFYLAPEHRNISPINKIQLAENCPKHISDKFFNIPTKLYLKEQSNDVEKESASTATRDLNNSGKIALEHVPNTNCSNNSNINKAATITEQNIAQNASNCETIALTQTQNTNCNDQIICLVTNNTETMPRIQTENMPLPAVNQKSITNNNTEVLSLAQEIPNTSSNDQSMPQHITNNEEICLVQPQIPAFSRNNNVILPVTFEEFKQFTFYEDVIDNLFKSVAFGQENIYLKYKNSQEAFNVTLMNYYQAFYLIPVVRDKFPIQFKYTTKELKSRLLEIPQGVDVNTFVNIRAEQLVFPELKDFVEIKKELNDVDVVLADRQLEEKQETAMIVDNCPVANTQLAVDENAMECIDSVSGTMLTLRTCTVVEESIANNPDICSATMPPENSEQCLDPTLQSNNKTALMGVKRSPKTDVKEPSPKRSKIQQTQDDAENTTKTKKDYKELLRYVHCCPVTFSQFKKYTNISELFTAYCLNRYKDLKKLPFILHRAYVLHYLAPENRKLKPFNKLKLTNDCPQHLKEKMFEIPENLYVQAQKNVNPLLVLKQEINKDQRRQGQQRTTNNPKTLIEILENRLLPPTTLNLANPTANAESITPLNCLNTNCVFHYISHHDFMEQTNILQFLPSPFNMNVVKNMFKMFIHKIIKESYCDDLYIHAALVSKILKHQHICENCEQDIGDLLNMNTTNACVESQQERASQVSNENVIEKDWEISERSQPMEINTAVNKVRPEEETNKSSTINEKENLTTSNQVQVAIEENSTKTVSHDVIKYLQQEKTFQKFRRKLLTKLNQNFDSGMDFTSDTYKIFLQCNEIPLRQILNDFCDKQDDIVERILKDGELCDALNYYYYWKYLTNSNFATKYPVTIRNSEEHSNLNKEINTDIAKQSEESQVQDGKAKEPEDGKKLQKNLNTNAVAKRQDVSEKQIENTNQNNKALEKAKRIFFRNVERINTLSYVVRTSFGLKQLILRSILTISYEEFLHLTNIYEGQTLYKDSHIAECMYRYVFRTPNVWPTNLFITLQNLCDFLHKKNIHFNKHTTMLADVSPKLLHWSDLRTCTNIEKSVSIDYEKRTGKKLNFNDATVVNNEFNEYYNRCWKQEKWLGQLPLVYIEFYTDYRSNSESADVTMFEEPAQTTTNVCSTQECPLQDIAEEPLPTTTNVCPTQESTLQEAIEEPVQSTTNVCQSHECIMQETTEEPVQSTTNICSSQECVSQNTAEEIVQSTYQTRANISTSHQEPIELAEDAPQNVNSPEEIVPDCVLEVDIDTNNAVNISSNANQSIKEFNCVLLPNTQQQINMLPAEIGVTTDPLDNFTMNINSLNVSASSNDNCEIITLSEQSPCIKTEPIDKKLLNNLIFYEDDDSNIQCVACEEEIVSLDDTVSPIYCDLLPSQLEFDDVVPQQMLSDNLPTSDSSNSDINLAQRLPSSIESNATLCSQQFMQLHNLPAMTSTQVIQLPDVSLGSSGENEVGKGNEEKIEQLANILQQLENITGSETATTQKEAPGLPNSLESNTNSLEMEQQQQDNLQKNSIPTDAVKGNPRAVLPIRQNIMTVAKTKKNVAKVRPLKNSALVPQIEHTTRPLVTIPVYPVDAYKTVNDLNQQKHDLIPANSTTTTTTTQSSVVLRISQELNTNCSVFDNSSLLRLVDHNYHYSPNTLTQSPSTSAQAKADLLQQITSSAGNQQSFTHLESNSQNSNIKSARKLSIVAETDITASSSHITSSTSVGLNNNDKVNNLAPIRTYKNLVATVSPLRYQPYNKFACKESLFRRLLKFHYFKELTHSHIRDYLLPSLEIGKTYIEATVVSEDFRTRLTNKSIAAIFPFWPKTLQRDFLLVLSDLKEFHYASFERNILKNHEDLRVRILFWLLHTAPPFALCQFSFEGNTTEFAHCERVHNGNNNSYYRKPFKSLTNAIDTRILERIKARKRLNESDEDNIS